MVKFFYFGIFGNHCYDGLLVMKSHGESSAYIRRSSGMKSVGASNSFLGLRGKLWLWGKNSASASKHDEEQRKICLEMQELESKFF